MSQTADFRWDAFVSYRQREPGKSWVRHKLVPALESAGITVFIDYQEFRLGMAIIDEMARAVEQSRYTVAVLTQAYLESGFTEVERLMAGDTQRLLLVWREACVPARELPARLSLDMTSDAGFATNIERLVSELRRPYAAPA